ncbi:hypothetical protein ACA106_16670 [Agrobacterium pusense]|uniref:hypothetical protein n=1 Tax=Agrobacterium pusense TaxID=648995 RepID=UPI0035A68F92
MTSAGNAPINRITDKDFDDLVSAIVDAAEIDDNGILKVEFKVSDIEILRRKLGVPEGDTSVVLSLLDTIVKKMANNCPGGRCAGTVTQKLPT